MKPFQAQTHYELLEVSVGASDNDIRAAYERLNRLYGEDEVALYGLVDPGRAAALREKLKDAFKVLSDEEARAKYDQGLGLPPRELPAPPPKPRPSAAPVVVSSVGWGSGGFSYVNASPPAPPPPSQPFVFTAPAPVVSAPRPVSTAPMGKGPLSPIPTAPMGFSAPKAEPPEPLPPPPEAVAPVQVMAQPVPAPSPPVAISAPELIEPLPSAPLPIEPPPPPAPSIDVSVAPPPQASPPVTASAPEPAPEAPRLADDAEVSIVAVRREHRPTDPKPKPFEVPEGVEFNGDLLKQVRLARGVSLLQLSERTRISVKYLEQVEGDRYEGLPATVYLRGILMSLARELGLDGLAVAKSYLAFVEARRSKG